MATIGKAKAVAEIGRFRFTGFFAWVLWGVVHIFFLIGMRNRVGVMASWFGDWLLSARDARLITGDARLNLKEIRPGEVILQKEVLDESVEKNERRNPCSPGALTYKSRGIGSDNSTVPLST